MDEEGRQNDPIRLRSKKTVEEGDEDNQFSRKRLLQTIDEELKQYGKRDVTF